MPIPLRKYLVLAGVGSRRKCDEAIREGYVKVNGEVVREPWREVDEEKDRVYYKGKLVRPSKTKVYYIVNKPKYVITSTEDPQGRTTVMDLIKGRKKGLFPVGRLDFDAEGLVLITNDGDVAYKLTHPKFEVPKGYLAKVKGIPLPGYIRKMEKGIRIDGVKVVPRRVELFKKLEKNSWIYIEVTVGMNRVVKRFFEKFGFPVLKLKRVKMGPLTLGKLPVGSYRALTGEELSKLKRYLSSLN